jgi:hypothetical protein
MREIELVTLSYESKASDSQNVSEDKNGTVRLPWRS